MKSALNCLIMANVERRAGTVVAIFIIIIIIGRIFCTGLEAFHRLNNHVSFMEGQSA